MSESDRQFWRRMGLQASVSLVGAVILALCVTFLSTGHLADEQRARALLTSFYAPFLIVPPIMAYATHQSARIHRLTRRLDAAAHMDALTGLANRRAFMRDAGEKLAAHDPAAGPLGIALVDIDHFKQVNDRHGHEAGDAALAHVAATMAASLPPGAILARLGGEEFALVVEGDCLAAIEAAVEDLRRAVATQLFRSGGTVIATTVSLGLALIRSGDTVSRALSRADNALYEAKHAGRNRVQFEAA
ncbi:MAG: diguanylate cyclase [Alphaproteobacteria bacterium]|nr:diguanylate cyclase [Alphaproteobacteria bacterium]